jgi:hypothetical protein
MARHLRRDPRAAVIVIDAIIVSFLLASQKGVTNAMKIEEEG